jgi:hypothetical protein
LHIIRLSYHKIQLRDVTGADQLLADLAELEATRLNGVREAVPVKYTFSLARDFPLAFASLKKNGACRFRTTEAGLHYAYLGTYGYRIRALTIVGFNVQGSPPRGMISNSGISLVSREATRDLRTLARFPDALPLSEFRVRDDMFVYGPAGETLMQFEGSGIETECSLELPRLANQDGLRSLAASC